MEAFVDYETLVTGKFTDERKINSRKRKNDNAVDDLGKYLLGPGNVPMYLLLGHYCKYLSKHESIVLPKPQCTTTRTILCF